MTDRHEPVAGILGGMGPEATVDLLRRIIHNTPASDDQDHIRCLVDNNPKTPSRIRRLLEAGEEDPGPVLADMARRLESWGADFLAIACNTAHNYYAQVRDAVSVPVLNMVEIAAAAARAAHPHASRVGLLASPAVRQTALYHGPLEAHGLRPVYAPADQEVELLAIIRAVKAGDTGPAMRKRALAVARVLERLDAEVCIVACTELGVILEDAPLPMTDAAEALAKEIVRRAKGNIPARSLAEEVAVLETAL